LMSNIIDREAPVPTRAPGLPELRVTNQRHLW
jgi:hypothetical protein